MGIGISNALFLQEVWYRCAHEPSSKPVLAPESGHFRACHRPKAPCFGAFWRLGREQVKWDGSGMNRREAGCRFASGYPESVE